MAGALLGLLFGTGCGGAPGQPGAVDMDRVVRHCRARGLVIGIAAVAEQRFAAGVDGAAGSALHRVTRQAAEQQQGAECKHRLRTAVPLSAE